MSRSGDAVADGGAHPGAHGDPLARFSPATRAWFTGAFAAPTAAQTGAWDAVASGRHALVVAPTGSGKTLAAFLWAIDRLLSGPHPPAAERCRVLYVSPLKALAADVERNLRSPLVGIRHAATRAGLALPEVRVGTRTGDTPAAERRAFGTRPPDILITTPESLYLILTSAAREGLRGVRTVILDEVHAVAGTKRGAHLAVSLERLDALLPEPAQRVGLSATVRPTEVVAHFLAGNRPPEEGGRPVVTVRPHVAKEMQIDVVVPVPDLADLAASASEDLHLTGAAGGPLPEARRGASIWPHVEERLVDLVASHRSTIVFANSRRGAERLTARMNEVWADRAAAVTGGAASAAEGDDGARRADPGGRLDPGSAWSAVYPGQGGSAAARPEGQEIARAHHGSMSREERTRIESELKAGRLPAVVATSSLELGIDMGAVDLVVQVGAPPSVASALQRIGRAGHQVGALSRGVVLPTHRGDLLASAVAAVRAAEGAIEAVHVPAIPLDVLAQQVVAMVAVEDWERGDLARVIRRAAPYGTLGDRTLDAVLDMLSGRYPSEDFAELRPRLVWDRLAGRLSARPGALRLAVTSGGTIPDRGLYGVYLAAGAEDVAGRGGRRVGELDEEMVYESRVGDTFTLGSSTWRIQDITPDRVLVSPAPGLPGRLPFWRGDSPGRPAELGRALGAMVREVLALDERAAVRAAPDGPAPDWSAPDGPTPDDGGPARRRLASWGLDDWAADNLLAYLREQVEATGRLPDDRTIVVERFRDEIGDWRLVIHSPWGARVHAPWALVLAARLRERFGADVAVMHSDDGIVLRLPDVGEFDGAPSSPTYSEDHPGALTGGNLLLEAEDVASAVVDALAGSAHFAARFREAAARSLLLPRRRPDRRQPLWQQRQRSAQLLSVATQYPEFPVVIEAVRECLQDDFDVPALTDLMRDVAARRIRVVDVVTPAPSPFARSLLFGYVGQFIYDGDAPLAERRAAALALDPGLLGEVLGEGLPDVADLLDPGALAEVEAEVGLRTEVTRVRDAEGAFDLIRRLGPLPATEVAARAVDPDAVAAWLEDLRRARRILEVRLSGSTQWAVIEDAARLRDALGIALPAGLPEAVLEPVPDPLGDLVRRHARSHGPFTAHDVAWRLGLGVAVVIPTLLEAERRGVLTSGRLRPGGGAAPQFCDVDVLRRIRRRSLAALRAEVEPVPQRALGVFLPRWQGVGSVGSGAVGTGPHLAGAPPGQGAEGLLAAVEHLAGARLPASALETLILPARVRDYSPALLDEVLAAGEVVWAGAGGLPGRDGYLVLAPADLAGVLLPGPDDAEPASDVHAAIQRALGHGGALFFRDVAEAVAADLGEAPRAADLADVLWDLVWSGHATNDTLAPLRARLGYGKVRHPARRSAPRARAMRASALRGSALRGAGLRAAGLAGLPGLTEAPPEVAGRWSATPARVVDATARTVAGTLALLDRHGVLTRGAATDLPGGFQAAYGVLTRLEETGQVRRGYLVEGLGAAQFALPACVEELRADAREASGALLLAATDPANPYGAALPWPERAVVPEEVTSTEPASIAVVRHRPGRTAGACVVLVDGTLVLYVERGGRTLLSFTEDAVMLGAAAAELARAARAGALGRLTVARTDGAPALRRGNALAAALGEAGFIATPRGLRLRHGERVGT